MAVDAGGDLLIADTSNQRVRLVAAAGCASGCPYGLSSLPRATSTLSRGTGHGSGFNYGFYLLIADTSNQRVRLVAAAGCASGCPYGLASMTKGDIYTVAGTGTFGFNGDNIPATSAQLNNPVGVGVDAGGDLLIADTSNQRVRSVIGGALAQLQALLAVVGALPSSTARTVLNVQVADAIAAEQAGNTGRVCMDLNGVVRTALQEQSYGQLTSAQATSVINAASQIAAVIGCSTVGPARAARPAVKH